MNGPVSTDIPSVSQTHRPDLEESSLPCSSCMDLTGAAATSQTNRETNQTQTDKKKSSVHTTVKMQGFYDVTNKMRSKQSVWKWLQCQFKALTLQRMAVRHK